MSPDLHFKNSLFDYMVRHQAPFQGGLENVYCLVLDEIVAFPEDYKELAKLNKLQDLTIAHDAGVVDFTVFTPLKQLKALEITAMFPSWRISCTNLQALQSLPNLETLEITEFIDVDMEEIKRLTQLKEVRFFFGGKVDHIEQVVNLPNLQSLWFMDITIKNLNFINMLSPAVKLDFEGLVVEEEFDTDILKRFKKYSCEDITINGKTHKKL